MVQVRYLVHELSEAIAFYTNHLGFHLVEQFGPAMAILELDGFRLWLAGPLASASRPMPDGAQPSPGGWNRIVVDVVDLHAIVQRLSEKGIIFRNEIISGPGGFQILCEDPSGNPIELFQAKL